MTREQLKQVRKQYLRDHVRMIKELEEQCSSATTNREPRWLEERNEDHRLGTTMNSVTVY